MEIEGYPNYLIYDDGRVYSKRKGIFLCGKLSDSGYYSYRLCDRGREKTYKAHRLVAQHYIPNPENKPQVDHIDRNRTNNHVSNLRWVTQQENMENKGDYKNNKSGHKNISHRKRGNRWTFKYTKRDLQIYREFNNKTDALCYKYICLLKVKSNLI